VQERLRLLAAVHRAAETSDLIRSWLESGELFRPLRLTAQEAWTFLREIPGYEACGIVCRIPRWWRNRKQAARLTMTVGERATAKLGLKEILDFSLEFVLNGETLTAAEIQAIAASSAGLAMIKGKWVEVDPEQLTRLLATYEQVQKLAGRGGLTLLEAWRLQLQPQKLLGDRLVTAGELEVTQGSWLREHLSCLSQMGSRIAIDPGRDFHATLRPYQQTGLNWLAGMARLRLGVCLADDMGLGKTVQIIALLNAWRAAFTAPAASRSGSAAPAAHHALIIMPATLLANWTRELDRFAPALRCQVLHPSAVNMDQASPADLLDGHDVLLTTYGLVERLTWLKTERWDLVILDEAQAIKNPAARQTRAVKALPAEVRIALTGTPIENRLSDLWSLFDFLNRGLLGTAAEFTSFCRSLKSQPEGYGRLRQVISPFLLRRVKTDPAVISDLPAKVEIREFANLTKTQAALYEATVETLARQLETNIDPLERRGLVLKTLLHLKQICNHPDLYQGQPDFAHADSGKFARLQEICETIRDRHERVLVFTQFREMCEPLSRFLASVFGRPGLVLHGQIPVARRRPLIDCFQGPDYVPFLVLSLKAGGTGLNLTAANHVIHFDRWWNPAVENQATDRAYRIGQSRRVMVHAFVTAGTVEEKIDAMIEAKKTAGGGCHTRFSGKFHYGTG
jgi:non-specific serine/threonine protein kinase